VYFKVVTLLLSKGANKEHRNISDYTPLSQAASGGYVNVIKVLLAHGAEINSRYFSVIVAVTVVVLSLNVEYPHLLKLYRIGCVCAWYWRRR